MLVDFHQPEHRLNLIKPLAPFGRSGSVVARSGASTLTEISLAGLPSILVPYPYAADDHQTANAKVFSEAGAALLVQQKDMTAESLAQTLADLLSDHSSLATMSAAARSLAVPDAPEKVTAAITAR